MSKRLLLALILALPLAAQQPAGIVTNPMFQALDQNGAPVPLAALCAYAAGTNSPKDLYTDATGGVAAARPLIMNGGGQAKIFGQGNYKLVLSQPGTGCPNTGSIIWSIDAIYILTNSPTFATVTATTFHATASGATNDIYGPNFAITGAGNASFATVVALTTFNSGATSTTPGFTVNTGTAQILGNGRILGQEVAPNEFNLVGYANVAALQVACPACTVPVASHALSFYNTTTGSVQYNLNNGSWVDMASVPGADTQVIYNSGGHALGASSHMTFATDTLTLGGASNTGVVAPLFNSVNTGTDNTFQNASGDFYVQGNGNLGAQSVTANNTAKTTGYLTGTASNTDTTGITALSGGTATIAWPSGHTYTSNPTCIGNDFTANHSVSLAGGATTLTLNGTGSDQIQWVCIGGVF